MAFTDNTIVEFVDVLATSAPTPGGGGASALVGAVGVALGNMVGALTVGKKRYADVEADIIRLQSEASKLQQELIRLIDKDAEDFEPLSRAYSIPKDDPTRAETMESALKTACETPLAIIKACAAAIELLVEFAAKGSALALSDAGVGAALCKAAMQGAVLNIYINAKSMSDRDYAAGLIADADRIIADSLHSADDVYASVVSRLLH